MADEKERTFNNTFPSLGIAVGVDRIPPCPISHWSCMKRIKFPKPISLVVYESAIELLVKQLGDSQTVMAQIFNDPENPENAKLVAPIVQWNKTVLKAVKKKLPGLCHF